MRQAFSHWTVGTRTLFGVFLSSLKPLSSESSTGTPGVKVNVLPSLLIQSWTTASINIDVYYLSLDIMLINVLVKTFG